MHGGGILWRAILCRLLTVAARVAPRGKGLSDADGILRRTGQALWCVRGLRITVWDVLGWLAAGMTEQEIVDDYPELEPDDFRAVYEFATR